MRRFDLIRNDDESGVSGTGRVAYGVEFPNGQCVMYWLTSYSSIAIYPSADELIAIHGHGGKTVMVWMEDGHK